MNKSILIRIFIAVLLILFFVACTNKSDENCLVAGVADTAPPYSFYDDETNELTGFDVEIATEIAKRLNRKLKIETYSFNRIIYSIISGKIDCGFGSTYITPERKKVLSFTRPYNVGVTKLVISGYLKDINTLDDLKATDIKVAARNGTIYPAILKDLGFKDSQISVYPEQADLKIVLQGHTPVAIATGHKRMSYLKRKNNLDIKFLEPPIVKPQGCGITVNKEKPELLKEINQALESMIEDGTYDRIAVKWFGLNPLEEYKDQVK